MSFWTGECDRSRLGDERKCAVDEEAGEDESGESRPRSGVLLDGNMGGGQQRKGR